MSAAVERGTRIHQAIARAREQGEPLGDALVMALLEVRPVAVPLRLSSRRCSQLRVLVYHVNGLANRLEVEALIFGFTDSKQARYWRALRVMQTISRRLIGQE